MSNENVDHPIVLKAVAALRQELHHLWRRHTADFEMVRRTESHVPHTAFFARRCELVGVHPPSMSEGSGDHEGAKVVIYIPDNGRDPSAGSQPE